MYTEQDYNYVWREYDLNQLSVDKIHIPYIIKKLKERIDDEHGYIKSCYNLYGGLFCEMKTKREITLDNIKLFNPYKSCLVEDTTINDNIIRFLIRIPYLSFCAYESLFETHHFKPRIAIYPNKDVFLFGYDFVEKTNNDIYH